jgi:chemotaxis protein histidine kinase CheA
MTNYEREGNIDFYAELYKSLDDADENIIISSNDENKCLITGTPLTDKYVTMICGHKFNYEPLYKDILNHKQKFNAMESSKGILRTYQIRCPYCRKIQTEMLPYYEDLGFPKLNGVNYYDPTIKTFVNNCIHSLDTSSSQQCQYQSQNPYYNPDQPDVYSNSKMVSCSNYYANPIVIFNNANPSEPITYNDTKCYCYIHKKLMIKQYKQEVKQKEKQKEKEAKNQSKLEAKAAKDAAKLKAKAEEKQAREEAKLNSKTNTKKLKQITTTIGENVVLGEIVLAGANEYAGCVQILKYGPNTGKPCGCKIISDNKCRRHL